MIKVPDESVIPIMAKDVDFAKTALKFFAEIISPFYFTSFNVLEGLTKNVVMLLELRITR
jgi:hypothetical protein